ncbi:hypothetical protein [Amycolatopsis thermophila]|uniref:Head-to-tail stopper n=1 Tax=Amycolatopsis thermophila TaxID=206084 RepID=A0ABU0ERN5_9PSEU|nr:hypothetical protein [Amycolatopsis thermophila]MDQ0377960.1 hypothetical protein [Amycolatopsis thermophila]
MVSLLSLVGTPNPVLIRPSLGDGDDGPEYGPPVAGYARWEDTTSQIQTADGRVVTLTGIIYAPAALDPKVGDLLAKGGDAPDWRRVEKVDTATWFDGTVLHHEVSVS